MRALVCTAAGVAAIQDVPRPHPRPGEAEISVEAAGICGLDVAAFAGRSRIAALPAVLGHELVGRLADGQRVVANPFIPCGHCAPCRGGLTNLCSAWRLLGAGGQPGCFAEFVSVPQAQVHVIPASLPSARAVLAEPLANVVHLLRVAPIQRGSRVAIVGAGLIGALALQAVLHVGAQELAVIEPIAQRRAAARIMGAAAAWQHEEEALNAARGAFDHVIDACGSSDARVLALALCRPGGTAALIGMAARSSTLACNAAIQHELRIQTAFGFTSADFAQAVTLLAAEKINLDTWIEEFPLVRGQQALAAAAGAPGNILKRLLIIA